jgi:hypothetical protein
MTRDVRIPIRRSVKNPHSQAVGYGESERLDASNAWPPSWRHVVPRFRQQQDPATISEDSKKNEEDAIHVSHISRLSHEQGRRGIIIYGTVFDVR